MAPAVQPGTHAQKRGAVNAMNWKLIFLLSLFGLAMGLGTVLVISPRLEPWCWLVIFLFSAWVLRVTTRPFLNGVLVGVLNSVWITASHVIFVRTYLAVHPPEADMMQRLPPSVSPRLIMAITGPFIGIISGVVIGLLAFIAAKLVRKSGTAVA